MEATMNNNPRNFKVRFQKFVNYFTKPHNIILLLFGVLLTVCVVSPMVTILVDCFKVHVGTNEVYIAEQDPDTFSFKLIWDMLTGKVTGGETGLKLAKKNFWKPLLNSLELSALSCFFALVFGGGVAYLITRTNLKFKKWISAVFIFPYIMPQWTLALVWRNLFNSAQVTGGSNGLFASVFNIYMPQWWCTGLFPTAVVMGLHYAPFAYILIGGIFRNMDANLEEAATILSTPKWKIFFRVTLPMVLPAILSTILLVFASAMGSYPVPHYLKFSTLATKYVEIKGEYKAGSSFISVVMIVIGLLILLVNQKATSGRKQYTTVTGKSGQVTKVNLGKVGKYVIGVLLIIATFLTAIFPLILFGIETFLPNPGDYSGFTTKWWTMANAGSENGMYGEVGLLYNTKIWRSFGGSVLVAVSCSLIAGTIGLLIGYAVSKKRRSKWANYVNGIAFFPYLLPSLAVGAAFFIFASNTGLYGTFKILIIVGVIKYIPFASRSSLNAMMQLSNEIEEAAIIQNVPWHKRMLRIIIPIQKSSILSGYLLPFITCMRELTLFMLLCPQDMIITTLLDYYDEMGLYALSSGINLILIIFILICNGLINKLTGASLDKGIGG